MTRQPVLVAGQWRPSTGSRSFQAVDPRTQSPLAEEYPVSDAGEIEVALAAAHMAFVALENISSEQRSDFLDRLAERIETRAEEIVALAQRETALPAEPRLRNVELPRTVNQLRQAADAARRRSWPLPTIDTKNNLRSMLAAVGPVVVFGPNNFPLAFNSIGGGDFAAAIAAGCPVLGKANSSHPGTSRLLTEEAAHAAMETGMPAGMVQLLYRTDHADGLRLVSDPRVGATAYTGSRHAGLALKKAADEAGRLIYLELSSVNPVFVLPGALRERFAAVAGEFQTSCLMGTGQFCTNPGMVVLLAGGATEDFISEMTRRFSEAPVGTLLGGYVAKSLEAAIDTLVQGGAQRLCGAATASGTGFCVGNTLLRITGAQFLANPVLFQTEMFGNAALMVVADDVAQLQAIGRALEGNLTGTIYAHTGKEDDATYNALAPVLRGKVGRLLNNKMPTGVTVSPAMNHGGPYPSTGHPGFTAVGIPASLRRFGALHSYDGVRQDRLPPELRDGNMPGRPWRYVDGTWTQADVG